MTNLESYNSVFCKSFDLKEEQLNDQLVYQSILAWDSIGHMEMIADLEDTFGISFEPEDIIAFDSYNKGKKLMMKYDVTID